MADIEGPSTGPTTPLGAPSLATLLGLLPPPGFSSVAIPIPKSSLYLNNPMLTEEPASISKPVSAPTSPSVLPAPLKKAEPNGAFTLLIVNDNPIDRKVCHWPSYVTVTLSRLHGDHIDYDDINTMFLPRFSPKSARDGASHTKWPKMARRLSICISEIQSSSDVSSWVSSNGCLKAASRSHANYFG